MPKEMELTLGGLTDEQQALLDMFLEKEDFQADSVEEEKPVITLHPEDRYKPFPLTDIQLAYVIGRSNNALSMSNVSSHGYFEFSVDNLDHARYERAWQREIERHDMLRVVILPNGTQQVLEKTPEFKIRVNDFTEMGEQQAEKAIQGIRDRLQQKVSPLDQWPLFEIEVTHLKDHHDIIHLSLEGLFGDDKSMQTMMGEVQSFYNHPEVELEPLNLLFRDYVLSLENRRSMPSYKAAREYWSKRIPTLAGGPVMPVIPDNEVVAQPTVRPIERIIDHGHWAALQDKCTLFGISPTSILISAFAEILRRWNIEENFCLNLTLFNRLPLHEQIDDIIGDFTDTLLLECRHDDGETFLDRTLALRDRLWSDLDNHQYSGMDVLREMNRFRSEKENVYMPVVFTSTFLMGSKYGASLSTLDLGGNHMAKRYNASQTPQLLIDHQVYEDHGELRVHWDVRSEYFRPGFLDSMYEAFVDLLVRLSENEELWHQKLVTELPAAELRQREKYNETEGPVVETLMHRLFLQQAEATPDATAVVSSEKTLTYGQLRDVAAAVCSKLRGKVSVDELVAVIMPACWEQIAAVLGIQWAGAAYLPIDDTTPAERVETILKSAGAKHVVVVSGSMQTWPEGVNVINVDELSPADGKAMANMADVQTPDDLAYVIYTSGSTGTPKGVMIEHKAAVNTILDVNVRVNVTPDDRCLAVSNLGFDLSVWDIFGMLAAGAAVVVPDAGRRREPAHWLECIERHGVTLWNSVPAIMRMLTEYASEFAPDTQCRMKSVLLSGDWLPLGLPDDIRRIFGARVYSLGGATEGAIWSIMYPIDEVDPSWTSIPYGMPLTNQRFYVLNRNFEDCPYYVKGALFIGGRGLARGYFADKQKTDAAFVTHPATGERLYRTGDVGYFSPEGYIVIQGREDNQVKVNGFRVELGEVEHAVRALGDIAEAVVVPVRAAGGVHLGAYLVPASASPSAWFAEGEVDGDAVSRALRKVLPGYMVPSVYKKLQSLPVNRSGKIDRKALPPFEVAMEAEDDFIPLETESEKKLAEIWAGLLGRERIGRNANFFELGGDSLLATQLVGRVHQIFGAELSVLSVYTMPVLKNMARSIEMPAGHNGNGLVSALNSREEGIPLFCVPGAEGSPITFHSLAEKLEGECPVVSFSYPGMRGEELPCTEIDSIASRLIEEMKGIQPKGPYHLAGFCIGGFVAHAMARKLAAAGEDVRCLLIDAQLLPRWFMDNGLYAICLYLVMNGLPPQCIGGLDSDPKLSTLLKMAPVSATAYEPFLFLDKLAAMDTDGRLVTLHAECTSRGWLGGMSLGAFRGGFKVFCTNMAAGYVYEPALDAGPMMFLQAAENPEAPEDSPMAVWNSIPGLVSIRKIQANHMTIMQGKALDEVVAALHEVWA